MMIKCFLDLPHIMLKHRMCLHKTLHALYIACNVPLCLLCSVHKAEIACQSKILKRYSIDIIAIIWVLLSLLGVLNHLQMAVKKLFQRLISRDISKHQSFLLIKMDKTTLVQLIQSLCDLPRFLDNRLLILAILVLLLFFFLFPWKFTKREELIFPNNSQIFGY